MASDAIFAPADLVGLRGNFLADSSSYTSFLRRGYLSRDYTNSIYNPYHNFSQLEYEGDSLLPIVDPAKARLASTDYSEEIRTTYLQLPTPLDPRITELARKITASADNPYDKSVVLEVLPSP